MHPLRPTLVRTVLTASLLLALIGSPTASAQEAVEEPAGDAAYAIEEPVLVTDMFIVETAAAPAMDVPIDQPVPDAAPTPLPTATPAPAATAAPAAPPAVAEKVAATVIDNRFQQRALTIAVGSTVTWTNNGNNIHTLNSPDGLFDSGGLLGGQTFSFTFDKAGTYRLICRQHVLNGMTAQVIVQ